MNIITMSRAGAIVRLILQTLLAFGASILTLVQARPDHLLHWWDWVSCVMAGLFAAQAFVNKAWAASSGDSPPAAPPSSLAYFGLAPNSAAPQAPAPASASPGAAQGASGQGFSDVAAADDAHDLIAGEEQPS